MLIMCLVHPPSKCLKMSVKVLFSCVLYAALPEKAEIMCLFHRHSRRDGQKKQKQMTGLVI